MTELLQQLAKTLQPYNYVVQRNWDNLPNSVEVNGHPDLDLFVSDEDYNDVLLQTQEFDWIDLRCPMDNYYPAEISQQLLSGYRVHNGFKIPNPQAYFNSLFYHANVHKPLPVSYQNELKKAFLEIYPAVKCIDEGVGFYDIDRNKPTVSQLLDALE